ATGAALAATAFAPAATLPIGDRGVPVAVVAGTGKGGRERRCECRGEDTSGTTGADAAKQLNAVHDFLLGPTDCSGSPRRAGRINTGKDRDAWNRIDPMFDSSR